MCVCLMRAVPFFGLGLVDVRVTFIPVARGLFKLVGEAGISLDFVSELPRTKSFPFLFPHRIDPHLCSAVNVTFVFHQVFIMFNSRVIQITLMFSRQLFYLTEVITDAVRFQVALESAEILVNNFNSSKRVILQPEARFRKSSKQ